MLHSDPVGLPGYTVMAVGFLLFFLALIAARRARGPADTSTEKRSLKSWIGIAIQGVAIGFCAAGIRSPQLDPFSAKALIEALVIALLVATTIGLFYASSQTMGKNWSLVARTRFDHNLVTSGPFAYIRHPIYTALFLFMLAMAIAYGNTTRLIVSIPLYALGTWLRIRLEERLLHEMFGVDYEAYAARVRRFVPRVF